MGVYRTINELADLKYRLDKAGIPHDDRAVVLDRDEWRGSGVGSASTILGFRIVWKERVEHYKYMVN